MTVVVLYWFCVTCAFYFGVQVALTTEPHEPVWMHFFLGFCSGLVGAIALVALCFELALWIGVVK